MSEPVRRFSLFRRRPTEEDRERGELLDAIRSTRERLKMARISFDNASAPEMVDASIYEINSLQAQYSYLLRQAKEQGFVRQEGFKEMREIEM